MGLIKSKYEKQLDELLVRTEINLSNNYKDAAQDNLAELEKAFNECVESGKIKGKSKDSYEKKINGYKERMKGYTHKDQKPYWT